MRDIFVRRFEERIASGQAFAQDGGIRVSVEWRPFIAECEQMLEEHGSDFIVDGWAFDCALADPRCPRSVHVRLRNLAYRAEELGCWRGTIFGDDGRVVSVDELIAHYGRVGELYFLQGGNPTTQARLAALEAEDGGGWLVAHSSIYFARARRAALAAAFSKASLISKQDAVAEHQLAAFLFGTFSDDLAPPGLEAVQTCAPAHAPPAAHGAVGTR